MLRWVWVDGQPIDTGATRAKAAIGYVPQDLAIYPDLSARENLRFFGRLQRLGGSIRSVEVVEPDLEAVFLHLTGKALHD